MNHMTKRAHGGSLIEVLISLVLVAVTMLGLLGLQLRSMSLQKDSLDRRNAAILVSDFADRIASNYDGYASGAYSLRTMDIAATPPAATTACASAATCTALEVTQRDWDHFQIEARSRLPAGVAGLRLAEDRSSIIVTIGWRDTERKLDVDAGVVDNFDLACDRIGVKDLYFRCFETNVFP